MGLIPRGSLVFTGYGDETYFKFHSPAGVDLGQPPLVAPFGGSGGVDGIVSMPAGSFVGSIGWNSPGPFPSAIGIFNPDFTIHAQGALISGHSASRSIARDDNGYFYSLGFDTYVYRYAADGTATKIGPLAHTSSVNCLAVNGAGTIAYYADRSTNVDKVYAHDLIGNTDLGLFVSKAGYQVPQNAIVSLTNGDVLVGWQKTLTPGVIEHYNASGTLLGSYALPGTRPSPVQLTRALTDSTIWISFYGDASTSSGVTVSELDVATYTVVPGHSFDPDAGSFEYDSSFCVLLASASPPAPAPPVPPATSLEPRTPCEPQTTVGNGGHGASGCNTGGVGTVSAYNGPRATAHVHADPVDGEILTGKGELDVWVELVHTDYPSGVVTTYRRAMAELADLPTYYGGRKPAGLLSIGQIEHGLSNEQGGMEAATVDLQFSDADDRLWRTLLEDQNLDGDELRVLIASPAARASA